MKRFKGVFVLGLVRTVCQILLANAASSSTSARGGTTCSTQAGLTW